MGRGCGNIILLFFVNFAMFTMQGHTSLGSFVSECDTDFMGVFLSCTGAQEER